MSTPPHKPAGLSDDPQPRRVLVAGDLHGVSWDTEATIHHALAEGCPLILQLGDFGFWPATAAGDYFLQWLDDLLEEVRLQLWFIDGNHDNHRALDELAAGSLDPVRLTERLVYLPRGARWTWHGVRFCALGGAASIDAELGPIDETTDDERRGWPWFRRADQRG